MPSKESNAASRASKWFTWRTYDYRFHFRRNGVWDTALASEVTHEQLDAILKAAGRPAAIPHRDYPSEQRSERAAEWLTGASNTVRHMAYAETLPGAPERFYAPLRAFPTMPGKLRIIGPEIE
ncbi:hypothetical protein PMAYCL1PPCAC_21781 [Pristionchus mayeri]|uniref:Uncharacterized protein n=1 Tax=Pristionchus mayeri TaxID=1317129 RepID=A0AAN5I5N8_9BILA|nr:hypothetical protein PMAYCL1PPCAC_21781 [Pristionchus mayeri]